MQPFGHAADPTHLMQPARYFDSIIRSISDAIKSGAADACPRFTRGRRQERALQKAKRSDTKRRIHRYRTAPSIMNRSIAYVERRRASERRHTCGADIYAPSGNLANIYKYIKDHLQVSYDNYSIQNSNFSLNWSQNIRLTRGRRNSVLTLFQMINLRGCRKTRYKSGT